MLILPAIFFLWKAHRKLLAVVGLVSVLQVVAIAGYYMPDGGAALGPRLLAPMIPFIGLAAAAGFKIVPRIGSILGIVSVVMMGVATFINSMPPQGMSNLLHGYYLPRLTQFRFQWTWLGQFGLGGVWPLLPLAGVMLYLMWELSSLFWKRRREWVLEDDPVKQRRRPIN